MEDKKVKVLTTDKRQAFKKDIEYTVGSVSGLMGMDKVCFSGD